MKLTGLIIVLFVAVVGGIVLGMFPAIDLSIAEALRKITGSSATTYWFEIRMLRRSAVVIEMLLVAPSVVAIALKLFAPHRKMLVSGSAALFLISTMALGPGLLVNVALKDHWGRPRPGQVTQFGGGEHFVAWWDPRGECAKNCSFVSGEVASAFWTIAPAALTPPAWRALAYAAALGFAILIALLRMAMGGHFLSDALFSGVFTFLVIWLIYAVIYRWGRARLNDEAIARALERFSLGCQSVVRRLMRSNHGDGGLANDSAADPRR